MDEIAALAEQQRELSGLLEPLDERDWQRPSRCDGWTVADVVLHLAQTNEMAIGSVQGRLAEVLADLTGGIGPASSVDDGAALMVARERGGSAADLRDRWQRSADTLRRALLESDPHQRVEWVAGQLSARTLATTRLAETWIHTGDVADALDVDLVPSDRLRHIARLAWRTLPYAFAQDGRELSGPVAFDLKGPSGSGWRFVPVDPPATTIRGDGVELCLVAARRLQPDETSLVADGADGPAVLDLVRTYA